MSKYKPLTVKAAKKLMNEFDKDQIVVLAVDKKFNRWHITTAGKTLGDCKEAADFGNAMGKLFRMKDKEIFEDKLNLIK